VVAKVELHFGELFPQVGFIVTQVQTSNRAVVRFYNQRATAAQWIQAGPAGGRYDAAFLPSLQGQRLWLSRIADNLGHLWWRRLALPRELGNGSLTTSLQQWLVKSGGGLIKHARYYYWLLLADSPLTRRLCGATCWARWQRGRPWRDSWSRTEAR
jgi:hypothetical protein